MLPISSLSPVSDIISSIRPSCKKASLHSPRIAVGLLVASIVVNATKNFEGYKSFELPIGLQFIWAIIIVIGLFILPESPRYTMMKGDEERTRAIIARLNGYSLDSIEVEEQVNEIKANLEKERKNGSGSWAECFRGGDAKTRTRILTGCTLQALQQLTVSKKLGLRG